MDRHEAIEWLNAIKEKYIHGGDDYYDRQRRFAIDWAILLLKKDAVPVVRCKDCVNYCGFERCKNGICDLDSVSKRAVYPNDFCSYGERKDNDI